MPADLTRRTPTTVDDLEHAKARLRAAARRRPTAATATTRPSASLLNLARQDPVLALAATFACAGVLGPLRLFRVARTVMRVMAVGATITATVAALRRTTSSAGDRMSDDFAGAPQARPRL
ncbi:MAG: hypothetical protein KDA25_03130 [Phycisphaerales bacterium]|nr:hypothetical protein [Phycisphaerales bacterium]